MNVSVMAERPRLSFWQIWNMCFGFLGIQFGFALQNANVSRIFQTLGADMDAIPLLWVAAPLTGLLVQPVVGYLSDRTWTGLGRRRPYFLVGAVMASLALFAFPNAPALWVAAGMLWVLDASINISMEPFRAFVGDQLPPSQRPAGFAMQGFFIGTGSVVASLLPFLLEKAGVANTAPEGQIPDTVRYAFYAGGAVLLGAIGWTVLRTREYPPEALARWDASPAPPRRAGNPGLVRRLAAAAVLAGVLLAVVVAPRGLEPALHILAGLLAGVGLAFLLRTCLSCDNAFTRILDDVRDMPPTMAQLAPVQFFSWFALFAMWIYTTAAVTEVHFNSTDPASAAYNSGANWVGVLFAAYNGFAALAAIAIPAMVRHLGLCGSHLVNTALGGLGLLSIGWIEDPRWLLLSMVGVGIAWASILSLPYAMLANAVPAVKMGTYMGIFNFFIVIPQLVAASLLGFLLKNFLGGSPINALAAGGISLILAGLCVLLVRLPDTRE